MSMKEKSSLIFEPLRPDAVPRVYFDGVSPTLNTSQGGQRQPCVLSRGGWQVMNYVDVEMEVKVRKFEVDTDRLKEVLRIHRNAMKIEDIAEKLGKPRTLVEHWFRNDKCFAIPDADIWYELKKLLGIDTDEFDEAITTFEEKPGNYDMRNRIYVSETSPTITAGSENNIHLVPKVIAIEGNGSRPSHQGDGYIESDVMYTLNSTEQHAVCYRKQGHTQSSEEGQGWEEAQTNDTLNVSDNSEARTPTIACEDLVARRLTPLECTRLQGFPDGWVDIGEWVDSKGKKHADSDGPKYKALGNSIALPFWDWMANRMCEYARKNGITDLTMASLFSGIGGFELVYLKHGCKPMWCSEIENFCTAVTEKHFGNDEKGIIGDVEQYL